MNIKTINTIKKIIRTPAFIYDLDDVKDRLHQTIVAFKRVNDDVKVFYSYKTNTWVLVYKLLPIPTLKKF